MLNIVMLRVEMQNIVIPSAIMPYYYAERLLLDVIMLSTMMLIVIM